MEINTEYIAIKLYLEGKLSPRERHDLEKRALDDPFLADALEGYSLAKIPADNHLSILQRQLEDHIALQQEKKNMLNFSWQRLSIAAAAGLLFITAGILFWMNHFQQQQKLADEGVEVSISEHSSPSGNRYSQKLSDRTTVYFTDLGGMQPRPESGWKSYGEYLDKGLPVNSSGGEVIAGFRVGADGKAQNLKIIKGLSTETDAGVVRLISNGPRWVQADPNQSSEVRISVKF